MPALDFPPLAGNTSLILVHFDMGDLSGLLLHGVRLAPERSEGTKRRVIMSHVSHEYRIKFYSTAYLSPLSRLSVS